MKKSLILLFITLLTVIVFYACGNQGSNKEKETAAVQYTCPMHSEVVQDKPGECPKCGMDLVEKK